MVEQLTALIRKHRAKVSKEIDEQLMIAKNPAAVELGRLGGAKKVPKGLAMLTDKRKTEIAKLGAQKSAEVRRARSKSK